MTIFKTIHFFTFTEADVLVQDLIKAIEEETSDVKQDLEEVRKFFVFQN